MPFVFLTRLNLLRTYFVCLRISRAELQSNLHMGIFLPRILLKEETIFFIYNYYFFFCKKEKNILIELR